MCPYTCPYMCPDTRPYIYVPSYVPLYVPFYVPLYVRLRVQLVSRDDDILVGRACNVTAQLLGARVPCSEGTAKKIMDYVRVELQRDGLDKTFLFFLFFFG